MEQNVKIQKSNADGNYRRLVILSDTHITKADDFNLHAFNVGMEKINKIQNADLYLHLGDVTQFGTLLDYEYAQEHLDKFDPVSKAPMLFLIGNHDALNVGYLLFEEIIGDGKRHFEYEDDFLYIVGIDSTKPDLPGGVIHHKAIDAVKMRLLKPSRRDKFKIVCFHHQLIPIPKTGKERSAIDDSGNMLQMLLEARADLVINGHRHISNLYTVSSSEKDLFIYNAGTFSCNKTRYRELFTYSVIDINEDKLTFRTIPTMDSDCRRQIQRNVQTYQHRTPSDDEEIYCKIIHMSNSLITHKMEYQKTDIDRAIECINRIEDVDLVVHAGNLTRDSFKEEFQIAKEKLSKLRFPLLAVPGHTDSKPPAWEYWKKYIGPLDPVFESDKIFFQGINSTTQDSKIGYIGRKKLQNIIEHVLNRGYNQVFGVSCFHSLIPTPMSVWRTELIDSGDVLSQFSLSQISLILNSSPSINFNVKIENSIISNGGNLEEHYFDESFIEIDLFYDGLIQIIEHNLKTGKKRRIGTYTLENLNLK